MILPEYHHSNFFISVHYDNDLVPNSDKRLIELAENFLNKLGALALEKGRKLHSSYSIVRGKNDPHAHFALSWLPLTAGYTKIAKNGHKRIARKPVIALLENSGFVVDNELEAIKRVTHNKKYLTEYVIYQPKSGQTVIHSAFFIYEDFQTAHSKENMQSYKCVEFFAGSGIRHNMGCIQKLALILLLSLQPLFMISYFIAMLF